MRRSFCLLVLMLTACEGDAAKLTRLRTEQVRACIPVLIADSVRALIPDLDGNLAFHRDAMAGWARYDPSRAVDASSRALAESLAAAARVEMLRDSARSAFAHAHSMVAPAQRTQCDLAARAVNMFMAGRR